MTQHPLNLIRQLNLSQNLTDKRYYWLFLLLVICTAVGLILLPPQLSSAIFFIGAAALILIPAWRTRHTWQSEMMLFRSQFMAWQQRMAHNVWVWRIAQVSLLLLIGLLGRAVYLFHPDQFYTDAIFGWGFFFISLPLMGLLLWLSDRHAAPTTQPAITQTMHRVRWRVVLIGCIPLFMVMQSNLDGSRYGASFSHYLQMPLFVAGVVIIMLGLCGMHWKDIRLFGKAADSKSDQQQVSRQHHVLLSSFTFVRHALKAHIALWVILVIALGARAWNLEYGIQRLIDESHTMDAIGRLWYTNYKPILLPFGGVTAFTWLYPYLQGFTSTLFGPSLLGIRIVSAFVGTAQVGVLYGLLNTLFNRRTALAGALILATLPVHVHFSRIGINNIADPLFGLLMFWFLARGLKSGKPTDFIFAGVSLGFTHYFYEGGRLFYTPFTIGWLVWLRLFGKRMGWHFPSWHNLMLLVVSSLIILFPMYYTWWANNFPLTPRFNSVGASLDRVTALFADGLPTPQKLWRQIEGALMMFTFSPEQGSFYTGNRVTPIVLVPFLLVGLGVCFWRIRTLGGSLFFWWLMTGTFALSFLAGQPQTPRMVFAFPVVAAFAGIGIVQLWTLVREFFMSKLRTQATPTKPLLLRWVTMALALLLTAYQINQYFAADLPAYKARFSDEHEGGIPVKNSDDMLFRVMQLPLEIDVYVVGKAVRGTGGFSQVLLYYGRHPATRLIPLTRDEFEEAFSVYLLEARQQAFFLEPDDTATLALIREHFPTLEGPYWSPFDVAKERQFVLYLVLKED